MRHASFIRPLVLVVGMSLALPGGAALAQSAQANFHKAYFLENEQGDVQGAAKLYENVVRDRKAGAELKDDARKRLAICQEEIAVADPVKLMPPETIGYLEINQPGERLSRLLEMLGLLGSENGIGVSPILIKEVLGIKSIAVAVTGFDPQLEMPTGVAVLHPGDVEVMRGLIETALPVAAQPGEKIQGYRTYLVEGKVIVCLTARTIIVSTQREQIEGVLQRITGQQKKSFADSDTMGEVLKQRDDSAFFFCADAKKLMPMVKGMAGQDPDFAVIQAVLDLDSLRWVAASAGLTDDGLIANLTVGLDQGHHNVMYNLMRTPPITRDTLKCIPQGAAGFLAAALSEPGGKPAVLSGKENAQAVTGLDLGREIFANIIDFAVYVLPPKTGAAHEGPPMPNVAAVLRVHDPGKSQALWTEILGIASLAAGTPTTDDNIKKIGGTDVRTYRFPEGVTIHFTTLGDKILVATTQSAMQQAVTAAKGGKSILDDAVFASSVKKIGRNTSKVLLAHPGRCLEVGKPFMHAHDIKEAAPFIGLMTDLVASVMTKESEEKFQLTASVTGLPDMGPFVAEMIQREQRHEQMRHQLHQARRSGQPAVALQAVDRMIADEPENAGLHRNKFEVLALVKKDHDAALALGESFLKRFGGHANELNNFAWDLLTKNDYKDRYDDLALKLAEQACQATQHHNWAYVDTLALAKFKSGDHKGAVELQRKAIELYGRDDHKELNKSLKRYEAAHNARASADTD